MKRHNHLLATFLILVGMGAITVSCEKEESTKFRKAKIVAHDSKEKGGEDDEDPIIRGKVRKHNLTPIDSAYVETIGYSSNSKIGDAYTNTAGEFEQKVPIGIYYFRVTVPGNSTPFVTDTIHVHSDTNVDIFVD